MIEHYLPAVALIAGIVAHYLKKGYEAEQRGKAINWREYFISHQYQTMLGLAMASAYLAFDYYRGEASIEKAVIIGWTVDSLVNAGSKRAGA